MREVRLSVVYHQTEGAQMKRWKLWVPLLRCPGCRRWLKIIERGMWQVRLASKKEISEAGQRVEGETDEVS